ncbi:RNA-binding protein [Methylocystis sp. WRRC1]|uniref:RNA-binding protein n=1 Tax=Methylocystis sp. WRRC1 TaxID=1732014 RepID=UPI001D15B3C8|nr:RNA-binding protein [Methylocystis sp. WRRC1]MCC3245339.1 RNA-binding protein [Methylocystis sp. WRRC1]
MIGRATREEEAEGSERTCIVTRRKASPETMIRFVRGPDGVIAPDIRARLPGRGVWVGARADLVAQAAKKSLFSRGLKEKVEAPPQLAQDVDRLLEADCLQMLALANKAGAVVTGFNKVADALARRGTAALIEASDGGMDGKRKLRQNARRAGDPDGSQGAGAPPVVGLFTSSQLDLALGRTNVIHAALGAGGPAESFLARCRRLAAYRGVGLDGAPENAPIARDELTGAGERPDEELEFIGLEKAQDRKPDE